MASTTLPYVRIGYPHLFEARPVIQNGVQIGDPRFGCNFHFQEGHDPAVVTMLQNAIFEAIAAKWPDPAKRPRFQVASGSPKEAWVNGPGWPRIPLVWGPAAYPDDPAAPSWVLISSAKEDSPPFVGEVVNGINVALADRGKAYAGAEVHASVGIFAYYKSVTSFGVSAGLNGVLLTGRELGRFDNKPTVAQMFATVPVGAPPPVAGVAMPPAQPSPFGAPVQPSPFGAPVQPSPFGAPVQPAPFG